MLAELKSKTRNLKPQVILPLICLIAFALRLGPLFDNRFHPDEALFSTWALKIAHGENIWLTGVPVDKPPLLIYLSALSFFVFGQNELAARVPNLMASVVSVVLVWRLGLSHVGTDGLGIGKLGAGKLGTGKLVGYQSSNQSTTTNLPVTNLPSYFRRCCWPCRPSPFSLPRRLFSTR